MNTNTVELLERQLWNAVEEIGRSPCTSTSKLSDAELTAFAEGAAHVLILSLESLQDGTNEEAHKHDAGRWHDQLRAAVGEQLRRRNPGARSCAGRKLNEWLGTIRDWRIDLSDNANVDPFDYSSKTRRSSPFRKLEREMEAWAGRRRRENDLMQPEPHDLDEETLFREIQREAAALHFFYMHLLTDREWNKQRWDRSKQAQAQPAAAPFVV